MKFLILVATMLMSVRSLALFSRRGIVQQTLVSSLLHPFSSDDDSVSVAQRDAHQLQTALFSQNDDTLTIPANPTNDAMTHKQENNAAMPSKKVREEFEAESCYGKGKATLSIVVQGASGDLAKKMTFPALFDLYANKFIPENSIIIGYARSELSSDDLRDQLRPHLQDKAEGLQCGKQKVQDFLERVRYVQGSSNKGDFEKLASNMSEWEHQEGDGENASHNRLYYFAIPPSVFLDSAAAIRAEGVSDSGWTRLVVEKPFGRDLESAQQLAENLSEYFTEDHIYRIDHYLGQEMVQNMLTTRFGNIMLEPVWNRNYIESVTFNFKEDFGTEGRGGYFDDYGMIRDVIQNHLLQVFCMVAMEPPVTLAGGEDTIRDEKLKVLKSVSPIQVKDVVLGQYTGNKDKKGYTELNDVPNDSKTETFASVKLFVENRRWDGVPFIFNAGKALDEHKVEVVIKFKDIPGGCQMFGCDSTPRNELVMQLEPENNVSLKMNIKKPGLETMPMQSNLNLSYSNDYPDAYTPDPYVRLLLEVLRGKQATFVRRDELLESWRVFTPVLNKIEESSKNGGKVDGLKLNVRKYTFGTVEDWMQYN